MKKTFYIIILALLWFVGFTRADVNSMNVAPATQSAISGSLVTFTITWNNGTGDAYLKYILPKTANYEIAYQNSTLTPVNNALLSLGTEHDPIFYIPANSNFSVTITAKVIANFRSFGTLNTTARIGSDMQVTNVLTSAIAQINPIADLIVTNILTGYNPSYSGDIVSYYITLQNIWSIAANGITFTSTFPIPTLNAPTATFNGTPHAYTTIVYPQDFVWSGSYLNSLNPGQTMTIILNAPMTQNFAIGTNFNQIAKVAALSAEYSTGNNSATATGTVQAAANVWITNTLAPFTVYNAGDQVVYTITYGNSGGKPANNVVITDTMTAGITIPTTTFTLGTLPAGSGWTIVLTGTLANLLQSWFVFVNTANITTTSVDTITGNNSATVTGTIQWVANVSLNMIANNITHPNMDNPPYGVGPATSIQAVSGDIVQFTITYANFGNTTGANATISLSGIQGLTSVSPYNGTLGTLTLNTTGTLIITWMVGPKNFVSFVPTARLSYNSWALLTDSVTIQEPLVCGDGMLTRNEQCDTAGNLGVLFSGQVCENQQGSCVLVTQAIINVARITYQYPNPQWWYITGEAWSSVSAPLQNASCSAMTGSTPISTTNGYDTNFTCRGTSTLPTTPISIDCGNGTTISWTWPVFNGTCSYAAWFVGAAQCRIGNDTANAACRVNVTPTAMQCTISPSSTIVIVDGTTNNFEGEKTYTCSTVGNTTATITLDCGNGQIYDSDPGSSSFSHTCRYTDNNTTSSMNNLPRNGTVSCKLNNSSTASCQQPVIVDQWTFGRCGDGEIDGYEECDVENMASDRDYPWHGQTCRNCRIVENTASVWCFDIGNANLSVQEDEYLPFRWKVDTATKTATSCNDNNVNKIKINSPYCTFEIYDYNEQKVDTIKKYCNESSDAAIFGYFSKYTAGAYKYAELINNVITRGIYGEYKIRLAQVDYEYCDGNSFVPGTPIKRVCETNFTVTKPYLIQKSSFGITPKASNIADLNQFYGFDKNTLISSTKMNQIMVIEPDMEYKWGNAIVTMMDSFISKYSKVAVKYKTIKSQEGNNIIVSKVPGKDIVVFKGAGTLEYKDGPTKVKPFTVIVDGPNLQINGSIINTNAMFLVNKWDITFLPSDDACQKTQVMKGIFVTKNDFIAGGRNLLNDNMDKERCQFGWLKIQGILIGNHIDNLVNSRRSQLNHRFITSGSTDTAIQNERRNEIFNGAAVLIEYSPSLRSALPPGASDFTKVLDIYKK